MAVVAIVGPLFICVIHNLAGCPMVLKTHRLAVRPPIAAPVAAVEREIRAAARREHISVALVRSVAIAESSLVSTEISPTGAVGVMQIEPAVANDCGIRNRYDVHANVVCGTRLLRSLLRRYDGDVRRAVAAFNYGPTAVDAARAHHRPMPAETRVYVARVIAMIERSPE